LGDRRAPTSGAAAPALPDAVAPGDDAGDVRVASSGRIADDERVVGDGSAAGDGSAVDAGNTTGDSVAGDVRDQLARVGLDVVRAGLVVGSGGNLSAREPGADVCWVTVSGAWLDRLGRADFVPVRISDGTTVGGEPREPSSEAALHLHTYRARADACAVIHLHPQSVLLLDALGEPVRLVTTDHAYYVAQVVRVGFHPPGSEALAVAAAGALAHGANCAILAHHGCSVVGETVELAHKRTRNLEEAAQLTYRALLLGRADIPECPADFRAFAP
jgi:L-fuculose-phosphate aldolase